MTIYGLKDKDRQAKLDALSDVNKFSERLSEDCEKAHIKGLDHVCVYFGKRVTIRNGIEGTQHRRFSMMVTIPMSEIEIAGPAEILKLNVWYPRDKFDGNPNKHLLVEHCVDEDGLSFFDLTEDGYAKTYLRSETTHFMYIEGLEVNDEQG